MNVIQLRTVAPRRDITHFNVVSAEMEKDEFYVITSSFGVESPTVSAFRIT